MWLAARKLGDVPTFTVPQQSYWQDFYGSLDRASAVRIQKDYWRRAGRIGRPGEKVSGKR
jgi:hypothetical protein